MAALHLLSSVCPFDGDLSEISGGEGHQGKASRPLIATNLHIGSGALVLVVNVQQVVGGRSKWNVAHINDVTWGRFLLHSLGWLGSSPSVETGIDWATAKPATWDTPKPMRCRPLIGQNKVKRKLSKPRKTAGTRPIHIAPQFLLDVARAHSLSPIRSINRSLGDFRGVKGHQPKASRPVVAADLHLGRGALVLLIDVQQVLGGGGKWNVANIDNVAGRYILLCPSRSRIPRPLIDSPVPLDEDVAVIQGGLAVRQGVDRSGSTDVLLESDGAPTCGTSPETRNSGCINGLTDACVAG